MSLFQSNLRKQIRKLPKILKSVKIIHYYSLLFIRVLSRHRRRITPHPLQAIVSLHADDGGARGVRPRWELDHEDLGAQERLGTDGSCARGVNPPIHWGDLCFFSLFSNFWLIVGKLERPVLGCIDAKVRK